MNKYHISKPKTHSKQLQTISVSALLNLICGVYDNSKKKGISSHSHDSATFGALVHAILDRLINGDDPSDRNYSRVLFSSSIPSSSKALIPSKSSSLFEDAKLVAVSAFDRLSQKYEFVLSEYSVSTYGVRGTIDLIAFDRESGGLVVVDFKTNLHSNYRGVSMRSCYQTMIYAMLLHGNEVWRKRHHVLPECSHVVTLTWNQPSKLNNDQFGHNSVSINTHRIGFYSEEAVQLQSKITSTLRNLAHLPPAPLGVNA